MMERTASDLVAWDPGVVQAIAKGAADRMCADLRLQMELALLCAEHAQMRTVAMLLGDLAAGKRIRSRRLRAIKRLNDSVDDLRKAMA